MKKLIYFLEILLISGLFASPVFGAQSFVGFIAYNNLGAQIAAYGVIQDMVNVSLEETSAGKYSINIINVAECSFTMGGVTFWFNPSQAGQTAYKTYNSYIQPNGNNREIRIPTYPGEQVEIVLMENCDDVLVDGDSVSLFAGINTLTAIGDSIVIRTHNGKKPKISSIRPSTNMQESYVSKYANNLKYVYARPNDCSLGTVVGGGGYAFYPQVTLVAIPYEGCIFVKWSDNITDNPRSVEVKGKDYVAIFQKTEAYESLVFDEDYLDYKPYKSENQENSSSSGYDNSGHTNHQQMEIQHAPSPFIVYGWKVR